MYTTEREGQLHFFKNFRIRLDENDVLIANTDGVYNGNIFEFKLSINNTQQVLFQAVKYLSRLRITGNPVPKNILLVSLNQTKVYVFDSGDYFNEIHQIYYGGASRNNDGFTIKKQPKELNYSNMVDTDKILKLLEENYFTKIKIDEDCIVGWAERFYRENPTANKSDFLDDENGGEIRKPIKFKDFILPFREETNIKFKYLMDKLNDKLIKKELGAFFTPPAYAKKAVELVREAIKLVPKGNDYIILDRCAGTGNLQAELSDEELSHTIVGTYEYYEYKVLLERFNGRVRHIIPPTDGNVTFSAGFVVNADALSEEFINNEIIKQYINNLECTVILFENPPYAEAGAIQTNEARIERGASWKKSFIAQEMKSKVKGVAKNDLANLFIWSGFEKYLRYENDSYILFSPVKYFKSQDLVNKKFKKGFIFNRKHFHAGASALSCIWWNNSSKKQSIFDMEIYDLDNKKTTDTLDDEIKFLQKTKIKKVNNLLSDLYDKRQLNNDEKGITVGYDGKESRDVKIRISPLYNKNIIGYLVAQAFSFENPRMLSNLFRTAIYNGNGFYLRSDNYLEKLPLFATGKYPIEDIWHENGTIFKSSDGGSKYIEDGSFLRACFIFTCLSRYNKCRSFAGSDKRFYKNELCFDVKTIASKQLEKYKLNTDEKELIKIWRGVLSEAKKTENYNKKFTYGTYQIETELNTFYEGENGKPIADYPTLNGELENLKKKLKTYYAKYITPKLFEYELLK
jgi:hypothetical protein